MSGAGEASLVERVARALVAGLELTPRSRSHRERRVRLVGTLADRELELTLDADGLEIRARISSRLPDGIHLRQGVERVGVELGQVRATVPPGLVPALLRCCAPPVTQLSLAEGWLAVRRRVPILELGERPERAVAYLRQTLAQADQLEREFVRAW